MPGKVFISHSHKDNDLCTPLLKALREWGVDYWIDIEHLPAGTYIWDEIHKAIQVRGIFLRICTPAAMKSDYMDKERNFFFELQAGDSKRRLIPLILAKGYRSDQREESIKYISAMNRSRSDWLEELRMALGVKAQSPLPLVSPSHQVQTMLNEMDRAIAAELEVTKRSTKGHVATDGQFIGEVGGNHLYSFQLEEPWEPQENAPLRVVVMGQSDIDSSVVTSTGNKITIEVSQLLPKSALRSITLIDDPSGLLKKLRQVLPEVREPATQLASKAFHLIPARSGIASAAVLPSSSRFPPNTSQHRAIMQALDYEVSYIIGPPGTGKTATLAAIAYALVQAGRSVLVAAHTNIAVDNAILKLAEFADGLPELHDGQLVRFGAPHLPAISKHSYIYPPNIAKRTGKELDAKRLDIKAAREAILARLQSLNAPRDADNQIWKQRRARLTKIINTAQAELGPLERQEWERATRIQNQLKQAIQAVDDAEDRVKLAKQALEKLVAHQAQLGGKRSQLQSHEVQLRSQLLEAKGMNVIVKFVRRVDPDKINKQLADLGHDLWKVNEELKAMVQSLGAAHAERAQSEEARDQAHAFYLSLYDESCHLSPFIAPTQELRQAIQQAQRQIEEGDRLQRARDDNQLSPEHRALQNDLERLGGELAEIESRLANLEIEIVTNAQVVATTLTKVYMGTAVRDRQFDVLILDEASIAQLPAVYIAATCATQRVIVFGDPYQLAPIVKANQDLYAKRWLGRDLFAVAKVTLEGASQGDPCSALLDEQFRMHPAISVIARKHVYRGLLRDAPQEKHDRRYENIQPMPGRPLVLCDTGDANPVQERSQSGRRNTHHINCVLALAKQVLATLPPALSTDNNPRIGIATPYRRQANEFLKQIKADKLTEFVRAGTVHKFQGLEFEVVIFDTVESRGADPSEHFSRGGIGSEAMRLVNVAVTRPQHKLIIVANLQWLRATLSKSDILLLAVEEAARAAVFRSGELGPL